jgi:16S rRNA (cytosine1402-N4)-methyltransferase
MNPHHTPVLLAQTMALLNPKEGESYLDGTAGFGGHAQAVMDVIGDEASVVLVDRDEYATQALTEKFGDRAEIIHSDYLAAAELLKEQGRVFDLILLDVGVSSPQLDQAERGFSFRSDADLDMRMDQSQSLTAAEIVNTWKQEDLANVIYEYGEERRSRVVARAIVAARPIESTKQLADIVRSVVPKGASKIDPATRTFQAIRIAVNNELDQLAKALPLLVQLLSEGGRLAVISFHSLEDRIVKQFFDSESKDCICPPRTLVCICEHTATVTKLTKKPVVADLSDSNPRARSAKLRAVCKK